MKRILILIFILVSVQTFATDYYVAKAGNDTTGNGSSISPWRTVRKASQMVTTAGDSIHIGSGTFVENNYMNLARAVSLLGVDSLQTIISTSYNNGLPNSSSQGLIRLYSVSVNDPGDQVIRGIKFQGNNVCNLCISIPNRGNVVVEYCAFEYFTRSAYACYAPIDAEVYHELPHAWGNKFLHCRTTNNGTFNSSPGALIFQGQGDFELGYNKLRDYRTGNNNNDLFSSAACAAWWIHDNDCMKPNTVYPFWNAVCELRWNYGNCIFERNRCQGSVDLCWNYFQGYDFSVLLQENEIGFNVLSSGFNAGITLEADSKRVIVRNNHFFNLATGVSWVPSSLSTIGMDSIIVHTNLFENIGQSVAPLAGQYPDAIIMGSSAQPVTACRNVYIFNNTAKGTVNSKDGIQFGRTGQFYNLNIKNNIITGFLHAPIHIELYAGKTPGVDMSVDRLTIQYNDLYSNGNSDAVMFTTLTVTNYTLSHIITSNPLFVSSTDFNLQSSSLARNAGVNVGLPFNETYPDMGAFEYHVANPWIIGTVFLEEPVNLTSRSIKLTATVALDGGGTISERGICFSTSANPTTSDTKISVGSGLGTFTTTVINLNPHTTYHFRSYCINEAGTAYSSDVSITTTYSSAFNFNGKILSYHGKTFKY